MTDENQVDETEVSAEDSAPPAPPTFGVGDLNAVASILEVVSARGAIRAPEMEIVGGVYNRLVAFLIASGVRQAPGAVAAEAPEEAETETEDATEEAA